MHNKILLAMATADMMCSASAFAADTPPATGPFGKCGSEKPRCRDEYEVPSGRA